MSNAGHVRSVFSNGRDLDRHCGAPADIGSTFFLFKPDSYSSRNSSEPYGPWPPTAKLCLAGCHCNIRHDVKARALANQIEYDETCHATNLGR